jgi:hypothetical protein
MHPSTLSNTLIMYQIDRYTPFIPSTSIDKSATLAITPISMGPSLSSSRPPPHLSPSLSPTYNLTLHPIL